MLATTAESQEPYRVDKFRGQRGIVSVEIDRRGEFGGRSP